MQRALFGSLLLALSCCPIGVFLMLRRMSLSGDAMAHAVLPGAAIGFLLFGLEIIPMTIGGMVVGLLVALGSGAVSRFTVQREDASMAAFYLLSMALGVVLVSWRGSNIDLIHILFGSVLALNNESLMLIALVWSVTALFLVFFGRVLVAECLDPLFLRSVSHMGSVVHCLFLIVVVLNMVGGFQALGTLLSVGLMMLPAASARFWVSRVVPLCLAAVGIGMASCIVGLLVSYHAAVPSGPAIILAAGVFYCVSLLCAPRGLVRTLFIPRRHKVA